METLPQNVLIVGAGPTGLVLALWLTRLGVRVRIIDKAAEPGTTSRALVVHARTLELYRMLGIADEIVRSGAPFAAINLWVGGRRATRAPIGDMGKGLSPFPFMLVYPQDEHERLLIDRLREAGVSVERPVTLVDFTDDGTQITARLDTGEKCTARYIAGCDGARSKVRETLGVGFQGGTYPHVFYVADVVASGSVINKELNLALDETDFIAVFPMKGGDRVRLVGALRSDVKEANALEWGDVAKDAVDRLGLDVQRVNWFSTYHVHHRVADRFVNGRAFLVGDAAHIHSPVGGQGLNTGVGDAVNLAWKLAAVLRGASPAILDTYEPERIAFARRLVATTDRAFNIVTRNGPIARFVRMKVAPVLVPFITRLAFARRLLFLTVSQINIRYRTSPLSRGAAGRVHGGDRLPWVNVDNFAPLASLKWQVHVYGEPAPGLEQLCRERALPLHTFGWRDDMGSAGLERNAAYVVRPDGYVGLADSSGSAKAVASYLDDWRLRS